MPFLDIKYTNKLTSDTEVNIKKEVVEVLDKILGKPEMWVMVNFSYDNNIYFRGNTIKPSIFAELKIYGEASSENFNKLTGELTKIFCKYINVEPKNVYINYICSKNWGWNGSNF